MVRDTEYNTAQAHFPQAFVSGETGYPKGGPTHPSQAPLSRYSPFPTLHRMVHVQSRKTGALRQPEGGQRGISIRRNPAPLALLARFFGFLFPIPLTLHLHIYTTAWQCRNDMDLHVYFSIVDLSGRCWRGRMPRSTTSPHIRYDAYM